MAKIALIWISLSLLTVCHGVINPPKEYHGFCTNMFCKSMESLKKLQNCTVVVGDLKILLLERTTTQDFMNISFPNLKEVTGFMVVYRVAGLESLGDLFPNLARIRGTNLLYNYALIVYDMVHLREIGLYNLLKIDRGGVILWGGPLTCFVDTVDWNAIAPQYRHVLSTPDAHVPCHFPCTCTWNKATNHCWNNKKCQRLLSGPDGEKCSSECLGCRKTNAKSCTLCREYSYREQCVSKCPSDTLILSVSNYCVTVDECFHLNRWAWNNSCVSECPCNYERRNIGGNTTCIPCDNCQLTCKNLTIQTLDTIQLAEKCAYINGSLTIHVRFIPEVMSELRYYLRNIVEVSDYIVIYGSITLTSLDFLSSLQRIRGHRLLEGKYSLAVYDMHNLQTLFLSNVTKNLKVDRGTLRFYRNPMLCLSQIDKLKQLFPDATSELDISPGLNGYSAGCKEVSLGLSIKVKNETTAVATFNPSYKDDVHYTILYVRIAHGTPAPFVPETCSDSEWNAINVPYTSSDTVEIELPSLRPASNYVVCIEKYELLTRNLARSTVVNFTTPVGKPEPPFIIELVASSSDVIVIRWVNQVDYRPHIRKYELDVYLVDIYEKDIEARDHCEIIDKDLLEIDLSRHAKVLRPPKNYETGCESMCGVLATATVGAMVEDNFDVCGEIGFCEVESDRPNTSNANNFIKSLSIDIDGPRNLFQIGGLAPFRDYRFRLRACTKDLCSRSARGIVRTLRSEAADIASITFASINESGFIYVKWDTPEITNGPVLSYTIEVYPNIKFNDVVHLLPQTWCVPGKQLELEAELTVKASKYLVRICSTTLAYPYVCNDWNKVDVASDYGKSWWWSGVLFGICLYTISFLIGWWWKLRRRSNENIPLIDATSVYRNESEPPAIMMSDFMPMYSIPLRDLHLE